MNCKHLRTHSTRKKNGCTRECLSCGYVWFEKDKPMAEADKADRARFEHNELLKKER